MKGIILVREIILAENIAKMYPDWNVLVGKDASEDVAFYPVPEVGYMIVDKKLSTGRD
jgi:hypothetical protein